MTLTFEVWIRVKVTAHRLNEDNICTKLDAYVSYSADTKYYGQTDEVHSYNPLTTPWQGIKNRSVDYRLCMAVFLIHKVLIV